MSNNTNLKDISIDKIETDIMSVLYANLDTKFSQYTLFNKLLESKYDDKLFNQIHSNFKSRFLLIIRDLSSKYDDILTTKINGIIWIVCLSEKELIQTSDTSDISETSNIVHTSISEQILKFPDPIMTKSISKQIQLDWNDQYQMYNYLFENEPKTFINWKDPWNGNTIFHELVITENISLIQELILENNFNFFVKNFQDKSPFEICSNKEITDLLFIELSNKITKTCEKNKYLESDKYKNEIILNTSIFDITSLKLSKIYNRNKIYIYYLLFCFIVICIKPFFL